MAQIKKTSEILITSIKESLIVCGIFSLCAIPGLITVILVFIAMYFFLLALSFLLNKNCCPIPSPSDWALYLSS